MNPIIGWFCTFWMAYTFVVAGQLLEQGHIGAAVCLMIIGAFMWLAQGVIWMEIDDDPR